MIDLADLGKRTRIVFRANLAILGGMAILGVLQASELVHRYAADAALAGGGLVAIVACLYLRHRTLTVFREGTTAERRSRAAETTDEATGALSRRAFILACEAMLASASPKRPVALCLIDMDHLKRMNDAYGHDMGDAALRRLAEVAMAQSGDGVFGRLGGDEFAIALPLAGEIDVVGRMVELQKALSRTVYYKSRPFGLSISVGIATAEQAKETFAELSHRADLALYESKRAGRGLVTTFHADMLRDHRHTRFIQRELRAAILMDELELAYQPVFDAKGIVRGCEALVRWQHPARGTISPAEFIPVAEQSQLIDLLGKWVLRRACRDAAEAPDLHLNVNVSASQLKRDEIVSTVCAILAETGMPASRLTLEITESIAIVTDDAIVARVRAIRNLGVRIALDDFGTGHSGFSYLREFPADVLKIDRSFIAALGDRRSDGVIVSAIAQVAHALELTTVAEGIETEEQAKLAVLAGCRLLQGFHFARPEPWSALVARLAEQSAPTAAPAIAPTGTGRR